jgi:hypothetical protein
MEAEATTSPVQIDDPRYRQKLEYLYARRSNIDSLIETLEAYERFRAKSVEKENLKTA